MVLYWSSIAACALGIAAAVIDAIRADRRKAGRR